MKPWYRSPIALALGVWLLAASASAHQTIIYRIGEKAYAFSLGIVSRELVTVVDQMVLLQLRVAETDETSNRLPDFQSLTTRFVPNIHKTVKVEAIAGNERKLLLSYPAQPPDVPSALFPFMPTVPGRFVFRISGTINAVPIDIEIPCNPAGHILGPESENRTREVLSNDVTRLFAVGSIACPEPSSTVSAPERDGSAVELSQKVSELGNAVAQNQRELDVPVFGLRALAMSALGGAAVALIALVLAVVALWRSRSKNQQPPY